MEIFFIGATGYIGSAVAQKLKLKGHQIISLSRSETNWNSNFLKNTKKQRRIFSVF